MARVYQLRMYTGKVKIKMLASKTETAVKDMPSNYQCPYIAHFAHTTYTTLEIMLRCRNGHITFTLYMYRLKGTLCNTKPAAMPSCSVCVCVIAKLKSGSVDQGRKMHQTSAKGNSRFYTYLVQPEAMLNPVQIYMHHLCRATCYFYPKPLFLRIAVTKGD